MNHKQDLLVLLKGELSTYVDITNMPEEPSNTVRLLLSVIEGQKKVPGLKTLLIQAMNIKEYADKNTWALTSLRRVLKTYISSLPVEHQKAAMELVRSFNSQGEPVKESVKQEVKEPSVSKLKEELAFRDLNTGYGTSFIVTGPRKAITKWFEQEYCRNYHPAGYGTKLTWIVGGPECQAKVWRSNSCD